MKLPIILTLLLIMTQAAHSKETVVLVHGLMRQPASMNKMAAALEMSGYKVVNIGYPSRDHWVKELAAIVRQKVEQASADATIVHFVTHSMGGILVRQMHKTKPIEKLGRVVMLSPPNQGSEVVNKLRHLKVFKFVNGPAGQQLGTEADGFIAQLGPVDFDLGVITGDRSINWINSCMIQGKDDGKVGTESAKVEGMADYKIVHATHPMILKKKNVIADVISFLRTGTFK
jgi:triacylglycerol lipase